MDSNDEKMREAYAQLREEIAKEQEFKITGDPEFDFPELFEEEIDFDEKTSLYLKKAMIEEFIDNVEIKEDKSIYDKRLKKSLWSKLIDFFTKK